MPNIIAPLTEIQVRKAKPHEKAYRLFHGGGLYLEVTPRGSRIWRNAVRPDRSRLGRRHERRSENPARFALCRNRYRRTACVPWYARTERSPDVPADANSVTLDAACLCADKRIDRDALDRDQSGERGVGHPLATHEARQADSQPRHDRPPCLSFAAGMATATRTPRHHRRWDLPFPEPARSP